MLPHLVSPTTEGLSTSDEMLCLPSLDTNLIRVTLTVTYFLCILKAQPGPIMLRTFGKRLLSESVNVTKQGELPVLRARDPLLWIKTTGFRAGLCDHVYTAPEAL